MTLNELNPLFPHNPTLHAVSTVLGFLIVAFCFYFVVLWGACSLIRRFTPWKNFPASK